MSIELTIIISDEEERKLTRKYLVYEPVTLVENDPIIDKCVKEILEEFKGEPDNIKIRALMVLK